MFASFHEVPVTIWFILDRKSLYLLRNFLVNLYNCLDYLLFMSCSTVSYLLICFPCERPQHYLCIKAETITESWADMVWDKHINTIKTRLLKSMRKPQNIDEAWGKASQPSFKDGGFKFETPCFETVICQLILLMYSECKVL